MLSESIEVRIVVPSRFALREMKRGVEYVVNGLRKRKKGLEDDGLPTHDLEAAIEVWTGVGGDDGVAQQVDEQLSMLTPVYSNGAGAGEGQFDAFASAPVATDPNPSPASGLSAEALRDLLASVGGLYIPAVALERLQPEMRAEAEEWVRDAEAAMEGGGEFPAPPEWLVDYPLPLGLRRDSEGALWVALAEPNERGQEEETVHDPVAWLEEIAAGEISMAEEAALSDAHPKQPWVVVDVGYGEGLDRYQVMHRGTRERRSVDASSILPMEDGTAIGVQVHGNGPLADAVREGVAAAHAENMTPEQTAAAYAVHLSTTEPEPAAPAPVAGDVEEGARTIRRSLWEHGFPVRLTSILDWTPGQRVEVSEWIAAENRRFENGEDGTAPPEFVLVAVADLDEYPLEVLHPDEDLNAVLLAERDKRNAATEEPVEAALAPELSPDPAGLSFRVIGEKKKTARVLDEATGLHYGDLWKPAEARAVCDAWSAGEAAEVRGAAVPLRDESVLLDV